jgi:tetratricopeptide (TPR) repeat protein
VAAPAAGQDQGSLETARAALRAAAQAPGPARRAALERAAARVVEVVDGSSRVGVAELRALAEAARALAATGRTSSSRALLERVLSQGAPLLGDADAGDAATLERVVAEAHLALARAAAREGDHAEAYEHFARVADSARLARSREPSMPGRIIRASRGAARALDRSGRPADAARYYVRAAEGETDPRRALDDWESAADRYVEAGDEAAAIRASQALIDRYERWPEAAAHVARARARIARTRR